jgi:hypothetical protein
MSVTTYEDILALAHELWRRDVADPHLHVWAAIDEQVRAAYLGRAREQLENQGQD